MEKDLKVVKIFQKDASLYQDVIQLLEDVLRRAKEGDDYSNYGKKSGVRVISDVT
jgi:hypothetical protein